VAYDTLPHKELEDRLEVALKVALMTWGLLVASEALR
jgi:hypothetical protein